MSNKVVKLYDVPRNSKIRVIGDIKIPPGAPEIKEGDVLDFKHVDGMYSLCYNKDKQPVHLVAWAEVEVVEDENN